LGWASDEFLQAEGQVGSIPHSRVDANVKLEKIGGPPWLLIGIIVGLVVLGLAGGGYLWYRRRSAAASA
jgi:hypothetical protein